MTEEVAQEETITTSGGEVDVAEVRPRTRVRTERNDGMSKYTFVTIGPQPPERMTLVVDGQAYKSGESVMLSDNQHTTFVKENVIFKEDIVPTPGG
jgi:hypothetical protein